MYIFLHVILIVILFIFILILLSQINKMRIKKVVWFINGYKCIKWDNRDLNPGLFDYSFQVPLLCTNKIPTPKSLLCSKSGAWIPFPFSLLKPKPSFCYICHWNNLRVKILWNALSSTTAFLLSFLMLVLYSWAIELAFSIMRRVMQMNVFTKNEKKGQK